MDIKGKIESCKADIRKTVDTYKPLVEELGKGVHAIAQDVIKDAVDAYAWRTKAITDVIADVILDTVDAYAVVRNSYGIMGEATEILSECKEAGLTLAEAGTLDDAVKRGIIDRYNDFYGQNNPAFEKNISAAMVGGLLYMIIHREALDAQEYHRTNMCSACAGCEDGVCDISEDAEQ